MLLCVACLYAQVAMQSEFDAIRQHEEQRNQELIRAGFNFGYGFGFGKIRKEKFNRLTFIIPGEAREQQLHFWVETTAGGVCFRLLDPDGNIVVNWSGHKGETSVTQRLHSGKHVLEVDTTGADEGMALFSAKGQIVVAADLDPKFFQEFPASPANGYHWPYLLFVPPQIKVPCLLVVPNNTGFPTLDLDLLRASASNEIRNESKLATRLGCALLVPMFPRPPTRDGNLYLHALNRDSLMTTVEEWKRVDLQLLQMIQGAQAHLEGKGFTVDRRVLLSGFSASGDFVNRFAILHPDRVLALAGGGIAWPVAPIAEVGGDSLRFPIGLADVEAFTGEPASLDALRLVKWFLYRGSDDHNDPVDYRDCYAEADAELIRRRFGSTPAVRWPEAERLYAEAHLPARLVLYPGVGHGPTPAIREDIVQFFEKCLHDVYGAPISSGNNVAK
jgi:hypothetical protein